MFSSSVNKVVPSPPKELPTCSICLDDIGETNRVTTECGHHYHADCYLNLLASSMNTTHEKVCKTAHNHGIELNCPNCRKKLYEGEGKYFPPCKSKKSQIIAPVAPGTKTFSEEEMRRHDKGIRDKERKIWESKFKTLSRDMVKLIWKMGEIKDNIEDINNLSTKNKKKKEIILQEFEKLLIN